MNRCKWVNLNNKIYVKYHDLEGDRYLNNVTEGLNLSGFFQMNWSDPLASTRTHGGASQTLMGATGCNVLLEKYYAS